VVHGQKSIKRIEKMIYRTGSWMELAIAYRLESSRANSETTPKYSIFGPILPLPVDQQRMYLSDLADMASHLSGLAIHDTTTIPDLPDLFTPLPKLSLDPPASPTALLDQIARGADILTIPFISASTDAGIALSFTFPPPAQDSPSPAPLGLDMWPPKDTAAGADAPHATSLLPLVPGCACHACTKHHRAYVTHLLAAKEMLGWTLLQLHNHHVLATFFAGVRDSLARGSFDADVSAFRQFYEADLPVGAGSGPRIRGYQFKSEGRGEKRKNETAFRKLGEEEEGPEGKRVDGMAGEALAEAEDVDMVADTEKLEDHGMGKTV
jgi:queuine tRNA-ribosyltransferase